MNAPRNLPWADLDTVLLDMDAQVIEQLLGEQYKGKEKLIAANVQALNLGRDFARETTAR